MNVRDIIDLMGNLSIGNDNVTSTEQTIFLKYLNLAHFELYRATASLNQRIIIHETVSNNENENDWLLSKTPFLVLKVYVPILYKALEYISLYDLMNLDPDFTRTGNPYYYYVQGNVIKLQPAQTSVYSANIWYVPEPVPLNINDSASSIPYPEFYHSILADGALYYLFLDEDGFKNTQKQIEAKERWSQEKSSVISYFYNMSGKPISTFSNV